MSDLLANLTITNHLQDTFSLDEEEKIKIIVELLKQGKISSVATLDFFNSNSEEKISPNYIRSIINILWLDITDEIIKQQEYFTLLNSLIEAITNIRYAKNKLFFTYPDVATIHNKLLEAFGGGKYYDDIGWSMLRIIRQLYEFTDGALEYDKVGEQVLKLHRLYLRERKIEPSVTSAFYNSILNIHRNRFISIERSDIIKSLYSSLNLSPKKRTTILNSKKISIISELIRTKDYDKLGITEAEFQSIIEKTKQTIISNKDIKKSGLPITGALLDELLRLNFETSGSLHSEDVYLYLIEHLSVTVSVEIAKYISRKFEQIKMKFIDRVKLSESESRVREPEIKKLDINPSNFVIADQERYFRNLATLLLSLNKQTAISIINNAPYLHEIKCLIPLVGLIPELDMDTLLSILAKYSKVRARIIELDNLSAEIDLSKLILTKLDSVIMLSNGYNSSDYISILALGSEAASKVGEENIKKYLDFYKVMRKRKHSFIPPINLTIDGYTLESGMHQDPARLLIGKIVNGSCIDLDNIAGTRTYKECLLQQKSDVIIVRDSDNMLYSRIFIFRRGNVIQLVAQANSKFRIELYKEIADQILDKSLQRGDNIDYIFVNYASLEKNIDSWKVIEDPRFEWMFPHADLCTEAILLASKRKRLGEPEDIDNLKLDFDAKPNCKYPKERKPISYEPTPEEIMRLKALRVCIEKDIEKRNMMISEFEPFYPEDYTTTICGEDWYLAERKDGTLEGLVIPDSDSRSLIEFEEAKKIILQGKSAHKVKRLEPIPSS